MPILPSQFWSRFHRNSPNLAYSLVVCQYLSLSLDPDLTETAVILVYRVVLPPYLSSSLDPDLSEGVVILAYLLVVCQYFPASFDPDLTGTA